MYIQTYTTKVDPEVATENLLGDIKNSIAEHFGLNEKSAWRKAQMLFSFIERYDFIDDLLCDSFDSTSDGPGAPKEEFVPSDLLRSIELLLDEEVERQTSTADTIRHQKYFLLTLRGVVEQLYQQSKDTGANAFDLCHAISMLRDMTEHHDPEYYPVRPD